ncbi:MAG: UDP-N-acetylmuramate--L-alanine ligase [Flavobacteriales bacterium]|nr:UDP-N-acetylmuramate--L-alanine ligase [Flavobacteriales bacterium]MCB9173101.1 UDP-N-acetylmuramate--L-alanine ligase [Flavobacteriales bacterium]
MDLTRVKQVYFLGVGGIGMSALARYFKSFGCVVSGYDKTKTTLTEQLEREGINIHYDENLDKIPSEIKSNQQDSIVIYTPAIPKNNAEYLFFIEQNIRLYKRAEVLGLITKNYLTIAVAGTHGKTTTSSIIAHVLNECGVDTIAFLGGISLNFNSNLLLNIKAKTVVVEADEFDRSFLTLSPNIAVVTSIDADHLDIYGDKNEMHKSYQDFVNKIDKTGVLITKPENTAALKFENTITYHVKNEANYFPIKIKIEEGTYVLSIDDVIIRLGFPGIHNVENAIAAYVVAKQLKLDKTKVVKALEGYRGVKRRFEYHVKSPKLVYIDDYAHHPEELNVCISSVKELYPNKKITGVFQPHLFSRTRDFLDEFATSLSLLDNLILLDIYPARELPIPGVTSQILLEKVRCENKKLVQKEELLSYVAENDFEVFLTLGAGDIDVFVEPIANCFKEKLNG